VHAVVDHVASYDRRSGWDVQDGGVLGVTLTDRHCPQGLVFQFKLRCGQGLWQHRRLEQFAGEAGLPVGDEAGVGGLELCAGDHLGGGDAAGFREVFLQPGRQARPAISMFREVPPRVRSGSGQPRGCAARLLGLSLECLQPLDGWLGICEHAGERRFHPRVGQVITDPARGVEPGSFHPG
jgi:hypothetical protein